MLTISVWPRRLKEFVLTHPLYKSPPLPCGSSLPLGGYVNGHGAFGTLSIFLLPINCYGNLAVAI